MSQKTYVGGAKVIKTQHGQLLKISFNRDDLKTLEAALNDKGWVNLNCSARKEISQYGQTHSISIDTWQPNAQGGSQQQAAQQQSQQPAPANRAPTPQQAAPPPSFDDFDDDIPF